jgi:oligopeptide/dipeptide ABC transporter ATP-binding protein
MNPPAGCAFHPRCAYAIDACKVTMPVLEDFSGGQQAACFRVRDIAGFKVQD